MKKYRTKIGLELVGFLSAVIVFIIITVNEWEVLYFLIPFITFLGYVIFSISYSIDGSILSIHHSFFIKNKIDIQTIRKITETNNPLSSAASSLDRLELSYGNNFDSVLISPFNSDDFIKELLQVNPAIEIKLKPNKTIFAKLAV